MDKQIGEVKKYLDKKIYKKEDIVDTIISLCKLIEKNDRNGDAICKLGLILRMRDIDKKEKETIVSLLMEYNRNSKSLRAQNIFLNEAEILEKKTILKSKPRRMIVSLTNNCNLRCLMCGQHFEAKYTIDESRFEYIKNNIPYLEEVKWQGGEVFLYKAFDELLRQCNKYDVTQLIATNGLLLNKENIRLINNENVNIHFSIDGTTKEIYEKIRVGGKFELLLEKMELVKQFVRKDKKLMAFVVMKLNYKQIKDAIFFAIKYGFGKIRFQRIIAFSFCKDLELTKEEELEAIKEIEYYKNKSQKGEIPIEIESNLCIDFVNDKIKQTNEVEKSSKLPDIKVENKYNLFCVAPWTTLGFFETDSIRFACTSFPVLVEKDLWNSKNVVLYREKIINSDLSCCNSVCSTNGSDSNRTKLGF